MVLIATFDVAIKPTMSKEHPVQNYKMYSVHDSKAEIFHPPFFKHSHGEAERELTTLVNDNKSTISQYPEDYNLYFVGEYNDQSGVITALATPHHVAKAALLKKQ